MVSMEVALPDPGLMAAGENEQVSVAGKPPHESEIAPLNVPAWVAAITLRFPGLPEEIVTEFGEAVKETLVGTTTGQVEL